MAILHLAFNFHDPAILLRLAALAACSLAIVCLGVIEYGLSLPRLAKTLLVSFIALLIVCVGYLYYKLQGF